MRYNILNDHTNEICGTVEAASPKKALQAFRNTRMSTGFYELVYENDRWLLCSSYGAYWVAVPSTEV